MLLHRINLSLKRATIYKANDKTELSNFHLNIKNDEAVEDCTQFFCQ